MKRTKILSLAAAVFALTFAACTKDAAPEGPTGGFTGGETAYANIKISFGGKTRAEQEYEAGTELESTIKSLQILLFDEFGYLVGSGTQVVDSNALTWQDQEDQKESAERTYHPIVKVTMNPGNATPAKLYAFINTTVAYETEADMEKDLTKVVKNASDGFIMTNSGYYATDDKGVKSWKVAADISKENLRSTPAEAQNAPAVTIHVERLAAKIALRENSEGVAQASRFKFVDVKGNYYTLNFDSYKWAATGTAKEMYVQKHAFANNVNLLAWANDETNSRSYWAAGKYFTDAYDGYVEAENGNLDYITTKALIANGRDGILVSEGFGAETYVTEHTYGEAAQNEGVYEPKITGTNAIIVGQYKIEAAKAPKNEEGGEEGEGEEEEEAPEGYQGDASRFAGTQEGEFDFYLTLSGADDDGTNIYKLYSKSDLIANLFERSAIEVYSDENGTAFDDETNPFDVTEYFELSDKVNNKYSLNMTKTLYVVDEENSSEGDVKYRAATNADFTATSPAAHYLNGWAYFFAPIEHDGGENATESTEGKYGVVRNHSYKLTVNSYLGLGAPLDESKIGPDPKNPDPDDPDEPIVPDPSEQKDAYINATLNVLSWHVYNQQVDL